MRSRPALPALAALVGLLAAAGCHGGAATGGGAAVQAVEAKRGAPEGNKAAMLNPGFHGNPDAMVGSRVR